MKKAVFLILFCFLTGNLYAQWSVDRRLTYREGASLDPKAACSGDTIHLVWWEHYWVNSNIREEVFYKRSIDAGLTWEADVLLSIEDDKTSVLPWAAVNQDYVHVVWQQVDVGICYRKSTDGGNSWLQVDTLPNGGSGQPSICVVDTNVYVVAFRYDGKIAFSKSVDNGDTWLPSQAVAFDTASRPCIKSFKSNSSNLMIVCSCLKYAVEIYCSKSTDGGTTWSDSQCVSHCDSLGSQIPAMTIDDSGSVHITWYDYKYSPYPWTGDIFYRASRDSGNTWEPIDSLTVMHRAVASDILAESNNLHLVWEDDRHDFDENFEIYYRMSTDLGQTWEQEERLTDSFYYSICPSLACDGQYLHLFWSDQRDDSVNRTDEIYHKRKNLVGIYETPKVGCLASGLSLICPTILIEKTHIYYDLGDDNHGELLILDVTGRVIDKFPILQSSGYFVLDYSKNVCEGIYFILLKVEKEYFTKKVLVVRRL